MSPCCLGHAGAHSPSCAPHHGLMLKAFQPGLSLPSSLPARQIHVAVPYLLPALSSALTGAKLPPISGQTQGKNPTNSTLLCWQLGSPGDAVHPQPSRRHVPAWARACCCQKNSRRFGSAGRSQAEQPSSLVPSPEATPKAWEVQWHPNRSGCSFPFAASHSIPAQEEFLSWWDGVDLEYIGLDGCGLQKPFGQLRIPPSLGQEPGATISSFLHVLGLQELRNRFRRSSSGRGLCLCPTPAPQPRRTLPAIEVGSRLYFNHFTLCLEGGLCT